MAKAIIMAKIVSLIIGHLKILVKYSYVEKQKENIKNPSKTYMVMDYQHKTRQMVVYVFFSK